ncbi:MAG TPA: class I SAM-dependent methyltransferase [Solirubrobacteraceae bacterium]
MRSDPLNDGQVVKQEYASEGGLKARASIYNGADGDDANDLLVDLVLERQPRALLEVGCGPGQLAQRLAEQPAIDVKALDISARMVQLARERGVDAWTGDVQLLPFADASFDAVIAAWMLYHVPDLPQGVAEIHRVLRPGGTLFAGTNGEQHLQDVC